MKRFTIIYSTHLFSMMFGIITTIFIFFIQPDFNSELGLSDLPNYAISIASGSSTHGPIFVFLLHPIWKFFSFHTSEEMAFLLKTMRLIIGYIIVHFTTYFAVTTCKENHRSQYKWWVISWIIFSIALNFYILELTLVRLRFALSVALLLFSLYLFELTKVLIESGKKKSAIISFTWFLILLIMGTFNHELGYVIFCGLIFCSFLYYFKEFLSKNNLFLIIILAELSLLMFITFMWLFDQTFQIPFTSFPIYVNFTVDIKSLLHTIRSYFQFIGLFITVFIQFVYFYKDKHKESDKLIRNQLLILMFSLIILSSSTIINGFPLFLLSYATIIAIILSLLQKVPLFDPPKHYLLYGSYIIFSAFGRIQELGVSFNNISLVYLTSRLEALILTILFLSYFLQIISFYQYENNKSSQSIITKNSFRILKNHNQNKKLLKTIFLIIIIINFGYSIAFIFFDYRAIVPVPEGSNIDDTKMDRFSIELSTKILDYEESNNQSYKIIGNDERILGRLQFILLRWIDFNTSIFYQGVDRFSLFLNETVFSMFIIIVFNPYPFVNSNVSSVYSLLNNELNITNLYQNDIGTLFIYQQS